MHFSLSISNTYQLALLNGNRTEMKIPTIHEVCMVL